MLTREENLARAIEDRDILETDIMLMEDEMSGLSEEDEQYDYLDAELHGMQNEVMYLNSVISSYEAGHDY